MNSDIKICIDKCEICINTRNNDNNYDSFLRPTPFSYYTNPFSRRVPQPPVASSSTSPFNTQNTTTSQNTTTPPNTTSQNTTTPPNTASQNTTQSSHLLNLLETIFTLPPENLHLEVQDIPYDNSLNNLFQNTNNTNNTNNNRPTSLEDITNNTTLSVVMEDDNEETCAICKNYFAKNDITRQINICSHKFHCECIEKWFTTNNNCPICRSNLS